MAKTKKPAVRFFSEEEKQFLNKFLEFPKHARYPKELVTEFCKKYKRDLKSIRQYVYRYNSGAIVNKTTTPTKTVAASSPITTDFTAVKRNEFIIPVTNWELRTQDGQTSLILKFK